MHTLDVDIETYSSVDLVKYGVYAYAESDDFEILMASFSLDGEPICRVEGQESILSALGEYLRDPKITKWAHNCQFERVCFSSALGMPPGEYLDPAQWEDTAAIAAENGLPRSLGPLAKALGGEQKDEAGTRLINLFCKPCRPTKANGGRTRNTKDTHPDQWAEFGAYCDQDVATLQDVRDRLPGWPLPFERELFVVDQRINDRGILIDVAMAKAAVIADEDNRLHAERELREILGIENAGSVVQIQKALNATGLKIKDMRKETVEAILSRPVLRSEHRRALELRQQLALVASKKYDTAIHSVSKDNRLRGMLKFYGAHTGRWSSKGVQIQNLAKEQFSKTNSKGKKVWDGAAELDALLELCLDLKADPITLKKLIRALFIGPFGVADYSAIEARVLAWVSGESWVLEAFRNKRDIYVETAERMSTPQRPLNRGQGKVAVLALGYNGGINSLRNMGAEGTDDELQALVYQWRKANPRTCRLWRTMEDAFANGGTAGRITVRVVGRDRHVILPSGRALVYRNVKRGSDGRIMFDGQYGRTDTYGGRLVENVVQAISRDLLGHALVLLERAGYRTVFHIHDEAGVEINDDSDLAEVERIMTTLPAWAKGFPLDAEGYIAIRYRKD